LYFSCFFLAELKMNDAAEYLRRGKRIQSQKFGRAGIARDNGSAPDAGDERRAEQPHHGTGSVVIVNIHDAERDTRQLPMKKKAAKRSRGDSDSEEDDNSTITVTRSNTATLHATHHDESAPQPTSVGAEEVPQEGLELTNVASPSSPVPPVEGVAQRISLLAKWFPAALQEGKLEAAVAPGPDYVEVTVERMNRARDYILTLRYGIEDVETLLKGTRDTHAKAWAEVGKEALKRHYWELSGRVIEKLVRASGASLFKEALSEFADEVPATPSAVAAAVRAVVHRRRGLCVPLDYSLKAWHDLLDTRGPEAGRAPRLSDVLWLSVAGATAMFSVVTQRLLRGARALAEKKSAALLTLEQCSTPYIGVDADEEVEDNIEDGPRFFDNTDGDLDSYISKCSSTPAMSAKCLWLAESPVAFDATLSAEERSLLAFLRYLMPVREDPVAEPQQRVSRISTGLGVWLYAAFTTLDTPLDPDTARLAHDLFRTCCRHLRTMGVWKDVRGSTRDTLLRQFSPRQPCTKASYASLRDVAREDVLALYTIVVVLARVFRQNQDHFIPL
jgi:hypothetical protein